eukprot:GILK01014364.1.p1 GENE.GILK01014364.1~~GILK01014364.1.p1  ORF type:complete len:339 (-),score=33.13 GILK01014364.1:131-1147(-)
MRQAQTPQAGPEPRFSIEEVADDGTPGSSARPRVQEPDDFDSSVFEEVRNPRSVHRLPSPPRYSPSYIPPRTFEQYVPTPVPPPEHIPDASSVWNLHRRLYERFFTRPTISRTTAMSQPAAQTTASHKASKTTKSKKATPPSPPPDAADTSVPVHVNGVRRSTSQTTPTAHSPDASASRRMSMPAASGSPLAEGHCTSHPSPTATASDASTSHSNRSRSSRAETTPCASPAEAHGRTSLIEAQARLFQTEEAALAEALRLSQAEAAAATSPVAATHPVSSPLQQSQTSLTEPTRSTSYSGGRAGSMYPTFDDDEEAQLLEALRLSSESAHTTAARNSR